MKRLMCLVITLIITFIAFYLFLPAINPTCISFWLFVMFIIIVYSISHFLFVDTNVEIIVKKGEENFNKLLLLFFCLIPIAIIIIDIIVSPLFNSKSYSNRIKVDENGNFTEDFEEVDFNKLALIDRDSSEKLGDRVMGQMPDYVSQFYVSSEYRQINYNDEIIRVTNLEYDGLIKWINNRKKGITAYITVNSVTGEAKLVQLDKGIKYTKSAFFSEDLKRKLRFSYPTEIFGSAKFEINNEGNPYWIVPTYSYSGISMKKKVTGAIIFDAITGKSEKKSLEDVPEWVDNVYDANLVISQVNDWGTYKHGFFNSVFSQKNVVNTTEGYNYLVMNDDVYLYTGITSVLTDESNIGFILTNLRTGDTTYYRVAGAEEYSAMSSATGQVQQMGYVSTFPLLINLNNKPTYLVSLKDAAGLVKMYAFIDVADYQKVVVTNSSEGIVNASINYLNKYSDVVSEDLLKTEEITVKEINVAVKNNNTFYYIKDENGKKYILNISLSDNLPFLKVEDKINVSYLKEKDIIEVIKVVYE